MNEMAWSYRAIDAKVWMLDLGRSFEKLSARPGTYATGSSPMWTSA